MDELVASRKILSSTPTVTPAVTPTTGLELRIGSNIFRNTNGVITVRGKEQLVLEAKPTHGLFLMTVDIYGPDSNRIAHLRRNMFMVNPAERFAIETHRTQQDFSDDPPWIRLSDQGAGDVLLEAHMTSANIIHITFGKFYSHKGELVEITPHYCRIGSGMTLFGDIREARGGPVLLG